MLQPHQLVKFCKSAILPKLHASLDNCFQDMAKDSLCSLKKSETEEIAANNKNGEKVKFEHLKSWVEDIM